MKRVILVILILAVVIGLYKASKTTGTYEIKVSAKYRIYVFVTAFLWFIPQTTLDNSIGKVMFPGGDIT